MDIHAKLSNLGLTLPPPPKPVAAYAPAVTSGDLIFVSGQLPLCDGKLTASGPVPSAANLHQAQAAAMQCALNALAIVDAELGGDWTRFEAAVRMAVYVASDKDFTDQSVVADGASELLVKLLGEAGRHARAAVGVASLPKGAAVELELLVRVRAAMAS